MNIPQEIADRLRQNGVCPEDVICVAECDRSADGDFSQAALVLTAKKLAVLKDRNAQQCHEFKGYFSKSKGTKTAPHIPDYEIELFDLDRIEKLFIVNLVASGLLVMKEKDQPREKAICAFTNSYMQAASRLTALFDKLREKGKLDPEDLAQPQEERVCPKCGMAYPEPERKVCPRCMKKGAIFVRLLKLSLEYKWSIVMIILFMIFNSLLGVVIPYLQGHVLFDWALSDKTVYFQRILAVVLSIVGCRVLSMLAGVVYGVYLAKLSADIINNLKTKVFDSMQRLSLSFFQKRQTGQLMTRVNDDAAQVQNFFIDGLPYLIVNSLNIVAIIIIMLCVDWQLTLLCMIPLPILLLFVFRAWPKFYNLSWFDYLRRSKMKSIISDSFKGSRVVKAFGREQAEIHRFGQASEASYGVEIKRGQLIQTIFPTMSLIMQCGAFIIWLVGGMRVMSGHFQIGNLLTFLNYIYMIFGPIQFLCNVTDWWSYCMTAAQRMFEITDAVPDIGEKPDAVHVERFRGNLDIDRISFGYEPNKPVLRDVSFDVKAGQMVGIVGHSGAGKSTLVNLITRLYDVTDGHIRIDGTDVRDMKIADIRRNVGIVSQEVYVFMGTVAENIAYSCPGCSMEDIIRAAKIANAHEFIEKLPAGYDTIVGSGGQDLSGGEKQRISIARAVLHNPRLLILDEATASLDTQTERQIQEALEKLSEGRTTIAIAHRLSTLRNADFLVVMENGKIAETGTHTELLKSRGVYFRLFQKQSEALSLKAIED